MTLIALAMCATTAISSSAQTFNVLDNFNGTDGSSAGFTLLEGSDGNFYGTTAAGGANGYGGTVFKVTPDGTLTTLYNFCSQTNCTDGATPQAGLLEGKDGNFYGTTYYGGTNCVFNSQQSGCGTIFKITPEGALTTLYSFCNKTSCTDGIAPASGLILGKNGNFYGTTFEGGGSAYDINCFCNGGGTVFEFSTTAGLTTLYNFCSATNSGGYCLDGAAPVGIVQTRNAHCLA